MKKQWPLPGLTADAGCPGPGKHCEQDVVYTSMLANFEPPVQMFGTPGCGRGQALEGGEVFPPACWEMIQNPFGWDQGRNGEGKQLQAIWAIANQTPSEGARPTRVDAPAIHFARSMINITDAQVEGYWPSTNETRRLLAQEVDWENYLPSASIPIIHHMRNAAILSEARMLLGL